MPRPATYDRLRKKQPLEVRVQVYLEDEPIQRLTRIRDDLEKARTRHRVASDQLEASGTPVEPSADVARLEAQEAEAEEAVRGSIIEVVVRQMGRKRYDALVDAHPVTDEQKEAAKADGLEPGVWNGDTFPAALISASAAEPLMDPEEVQVLLDEWTTAECTELFTAALAVNTGRRTVDLGKG